MNIIKYYVELPLLPINEKINIAKIVVLNWNSIERQSNNMLTYGMLTHMNPIDFPVGKTELDYMSDENISPVIIEDTSGIKYRTSYLFWFPLIDIFDGILAKQFITKQKVFPKQIFVDTDTQYMVELLNLVGVKILSLLKPQL